MARLAIKSTNKKGGYLKFKVAICWEKNKHKDFIFYVSCGPTDFDNPKPALTIMTHEDL